MTGQTINRMESLPSEMRKVIREFMTTKEDRQSYAACSDRIASELFDKSTCKSLTIEKTDEKDVYNVRIGMENSFDTIVTFRNVESNCEIKWNYFSVSLDDPPVIIENSNSEKEVVRMFEEYLKKYGERIETLELKKIDFIFTRDPLLAFKKLKHLKIETSNDIMAKYFIDKIRTRVILEVRPIGDNFSNDVVAKSPRLERLKMLKYYSTTTTDEQFRRMFSYVKDIEISIGNITIGQLRQIILTNLERFRPIDFMLTIIATSPFELADFKCIEEDFIIEYPINKFGNEKMVLCGNTFLGLKSYRRQNRLKIQASADLRGRQFVIEEDDEEVEQVEQNHS